MDFAFWWCLADFQGNSTCWFLYKCALQQTVQIKHRSKQKPVVWRTSQWLALWILLLLGNIIPKQHSSTLPFCRQHPEFCNHCFYPMAIYWNPHTSSRMKNVSLLWSSFTLEHGYTNIPLAKKLEKQKEWGRSNWVQSTTKTLMYKILVLESEGHMCVYISQYNYDVKYFYINLYVSIYY